MNICVIGKGNVGKTLGRRWSASHSVVYGVRSPKDLGEKDPSLAVVGADVVVLATPWGAVEPAFFDGLDLSGKVLVDCTNPIAADFSGLDWCGEESGAEKVACLAPGARVVKAFNTIGYNIMDDPDFGGTPASLLIAGDDEEAKQVVAQLGAELGFQVEDAGPLSQARWLESLAWLWISLAVKHGYGRDIAFGLLRR